MFQLDVELPHQEKLNKEECCGVGKVKFRGACFKPHWHLYSHFWEIKRPHYGFYKTERIFILPALARRSRREQLPLVPRMPATPAMANRQWTSSAWTYHFKASGCSPSPKGPNP